MANLAQFELPVGMQDVLRQFEEWRSLHAGRRPIPEALWVLATDLAREHGVFRTAKVLRLDYNKLKSQIPSTQPDAKPPTAYRRCIRKLPRRTHPLPVNAPSRWKDHAAECGFNGKDPPSRIWWG